MKRILYVVHRYGYPGGSEVYTQNMAEETLARGHQVTVLTGETSADSINGVTVSLDPNILVNQTWDLIVVHGGNVPMQNLVLSNAHQIPSSILYMQILPSDSPVCQLGLGNCRWIGCSTQADWQHADKYGVRDKAVYIPHGIDLKTSTGQPGFKTKFDISGPMFLSSGGFWPHKAMTELAELWTNLKMTPTLVLTGYDNRYGIQPKSTNNIKSIFLEDRQDVLNAILEADCYLMHSWEEGFGLVLLESMWNSTPWIARDIAGATRLNAWGKTYTTDEQLAGLLLGFDSLAWNLPAAKEYVAANHSIANTVDAILNLI